MYKSRQIATYFLEKYSANGNITPMKLIKLVYIAHGWYLGLTGNVLIDENPEAWKYGPVIPSIYHDYKAYRNSPIVFATKTNATTGDPTTDRFLDKIWEVYGRYTGTELSAKTHMPNTPWSKTWFDIQHKNRASLQINEIDIKDHYQQLASRNANPA